MTYKITILGCGDSGGVPRIGNDWGLCDPLEPKNRRTRPSIIVERRNTRIVVDTGPDFGLQMTRQNIKTVDAVLYTHAHSDHILGMDELRHITYRVKKKLPIFLDEATYGSLVKRFEYLFVQSSSFYPAVVDPVFIKPESLGQVHTFQDIDFVPFTQDHGQGNHSLGFRFGDIGYSTDMVDLDENAISVLKGVKIWIADCADYGHGDNILHADFKKVLALNQSIGAEHVYLTHLKMFYDYNKMKSELPDGYEPLYDGLTIEA
jgi:phosphoribosyl 1,2-cyclic phosphate phosphodiesterase